MKSNSRISSVLKASCIDSSITGVETFHLSELKNSSNIDFELPTNIRLGHLVERIVAQLIKASSNFSVLYENVQIMEGKTTIGEIDFIIENKKTKQTLHLELAYKFYLLDPTISFDTMNNWIGPNRTDSLKQKVEKLNAKQFPLLHHKNAKAFFPEIDLEKTDSSLCLLASLFIPYQYKNKINSVYAKAIKGHYFNFETFKNLNNSSKSYCIPSKKEWGIDPAENENWLPFEQIESEIKKRILEKQSPLCWEKNNNEYSAFFIVWW